jgi:hypothetical protein
MTAVNMSKCISFTHQANLLHEFQTHGTLPAHNIHWPGAGQEQSDPYTNILSKSFSIGRKKN